MARPASRTEQRGPRRLLPVPAGGFVGRARELDEVLSALERGVRVLTLLGPPGTGKTRLALEAARLAETRDAARTPVFVELSAARALDEAIAAIAAALGLRQRASADEAEVTEGIVALLAGARTLLVLDNLEQLAGAPGVVAWLTTVVERAPELLVLGTSRELLRVRGELSIDVPPLEVPAEDASLEVARATASVALLFSAAPQAPSEEDTEALAAIARALEGIPLALELAASRLPVLGATALRDRLAAGLPARLDVLGHGRRDAPDRQATLRGAFDWSWALLAPEERRAMSALALVRGQLDAALAEAIVARAVAAPGALDLVQSLRDKSLLAKGEAGRLYVLESLRAYAREQLVAEGAEPSAAVRRAVVLTLGEEAARARKPLGGARARAGFERLARLREPLRSAIEEATALGSRAPDVLSATAEAALALESVRARLGVTGSLEPVLTDLVAGHASLPPETSAELALALARLQRDRGELRGATSVLERAASAAPPAEERRLLVELGELLLSQGRFEEAREPIDDAKASATRAQDLAVEQRAEAALGLLAHGRGRLPEADRHYARALDLAHRLGDARAQAHALKDLGNLALQRGEHDAARAFYEDALEVQGGVDHRLEGVVRGNLAILRQERGELEEAITELKRALTCLRAVGDHPFEGQLLGYLGAVHHERGQLDLARETYQKAITILREVRDVRLEGLFLAARASACAQKGAIGHARNDLAVASRRLEEVGDPTLLAALALHRAAVGFAEAPADPDAKATALRQATAALDAAQPLLSSSDDVRFAARMLRRMLPKDGLVVGTEGRWFQSEGGERVDLRARTTLARVLDALAQARIERAGSPLSWEALLEAGWPGERVLPHAGQNRVRVALTSLRNLGLRTVLLTQPGGHCLDPKVRLERG